MSHRSKHWLLLLLSLIAFGPIGAQEREDGKVTGSIRGEVINASTGEGVPSASVVVVSTSRGAATDLDGSFLIPLLPPGTYHLQVSALGYETQVKSELLVMPGRTRSVRFELQPSAIEREAVTITAPLFTKSEPNMQVSSRSLSHEEIRRAPGAAEDVQRMLQALPGVAGESDQNNEIVVRGGSPYENLIIMDGIEVDNINHFGYAAGTGGPITAINSAFLREVTFASGGFGARYGDRLSSVLALNLREGDRQQAHATLDLSMAGAGGNFEVPYADGRGSILVAAHKSYLDLIHDQVGLVAVPHYWNAQAKAAYDISNKHFLTMNLLVADDHISIDEDESSAYNRGAEKVDNENLKYVVGGRLRSLWGPGYTDLIVARSFVDYQADVWEVDIDGDGNRVDRYVARQYNREITDQVHLHWKGESFGQDNWAAGVGIKPITFSHELFTSPDTTLLIDGYLAPADSQPDTLIRGARDIYEETTSFKYYGYLQYEWRPVHGLTLTAGLRYDAFDYSGEGGTGPRTSLSYQFTDRFILDAAYGIYYQAQPLIAYTYEENGENQHLPHARADQYVAGLTFYPRPSTRLSVEGYYKDYADLLVSEQAIVRESTGNYAFRSDRRLPLRTKEVWGVEFFAHQKLTGHWYGTASYSFGRATSEDPAYGSYPSDYDFRQVATLVLGYKTSFIDKRWYRDLLKTPVVGWLFYPMPINGDEVQLSTRLRTVDGRPYTTQRWYDEGELSPEPLYEGHWEGDQHNGSRYPDYWRWDLRLDNKHYFRGHSLTFYLEVQNVLDHQNIFEYSYADDGEIDEVEQFRFFFVGGVKYEF